MTIPKYFVEIEKRICLDQIRLSRGGDFINLTSNEMFAELIAKIKAIKSNDSDLQDWYTEHEFTREERIGEREIVLKLRISGWYRIDPALCEIGDTLRYHQETSQNTIVIKNRAFETQSFLVGNVVFRNEYWTRIS